MGRHHSPRRYHQRRSRSRDYDRRRRYSCSRSRSHSRHWDRRSKHVESTNTIKITHPRELEMKNDTNLVKVASGRYQTGNDTKMVKIDLNASSLPGQLDHDKAAAMFLPHCGPTPARGGLPPPTTIQRIQAKDPEGNPIGGENWVFQQKPKTQQPSNSTSGYASG